MMLRGVLYIGTIYVLCFVSMIFWCCRYIDGYSDGFMFLYLKSSNHSYFVVIYKHCNLNQAIQYNSEWA